MQEGLPKHYHLVGVAGVGMSALAQVLVAQGHRVTGSDRHVDQGLSLEVIRKLTGAGVEIVPQDGSAIGAGTSAVVVSTAIEQDNPDLRAAGRLKIRVMHRADMLACLAMGHKLITVTGTSGKTTVTGMIGWILECAGLDPTVVNGGAVVNWRSDYRIGNVRVGRNGPWVIEADESDRSLLRFMPDWTVITNISKDHFELSELGDLFRSFAGQVKIGIVAGAGVGDVLRAGDSRKPGVALVEEPFEPEETGGQYSFWHKGLLFEPSLIGRHNAENAHAAVLLCDQIGVNLSAVHNAVASFRGIERRLESLGTINGVTVVDDYAHNPAKISAVWRALAARHRRILAAWRPHGYGPLGAMLKELTAAFAAACRPDDELFILPVYYAGGTAKKAVSSDDLVASLKAKGVRASMADYESLQPRILGSAQPGDCVLVMGARDPELPAFARRISQALMKKA